MLARIRNRTRFRENFKTIQPQKAEQLTVHRTISATVSPSGGERPSSRRRKLTGNGGENQLTSAEFPRSSRSAMTARRRLQRRETTSPLEIAYRREREREGFDLSFSALDVFDDSDGSRKVGGRSGVDRRRDLCPVAWTSPHIVKTERFQINTLNKKTPKRYLFYE